MTKHIIVTGGVVSSLGKGITAASLGRLLKSRGYKVTMQKADPYLNVDPGTMSPTQHGEVFVTDDGHEGDLDLGHYERFIDENLTRESNFTAGRIYQELLDDDRAGDFSGGTVQVVPNMTNAIRERFIKVAESDTDIAITEIGGTVGDIESLPFIEAARQFKMSKPHGDVIFIHVTLVPYVAAAHELKTKPTQHSVKELRSNGVQPDFIVCRSDHEINGQVKDKIALFCDVDVANVISCQDVDNIYTVPMVMYDQGFDQRVLEALGLEVPPIDLSDWREYINKSEALTEEVNIALVGEYISLPDAYISFVEALRHAGVAAGYKVNTHMIDVVALAEQDVEKTLGAMDGILVPGGYRKSAFEGKVAAAHYARLNQVPFMGVCLGLQAAVVEYARSVLGLTEANTTENAEDVTSIVDPVIIHMSDEELVAAAASITRPAASREVSGRLGAYPCQLVKGTKAYQVYQEDLIYERFNHSFVVNNSYRQQLVDAGLIIGGTSPDGVFVNMVELADHPWYVCTLGHPEFKSRPTRPHPLLVGFVQAVGQVSK
ncbi:MAG: CTP synthase [Coriobacteriales bacterium]|jgi:CTP synthase|nr:CTP synthase [Coriobacteriales bacterium]